MSADVEIAFSPDEMKELNEIEQLIADKKKELSSATLRRIEFELKERQIANEVFAAGQELIRRVSKVSLLHGVDFEKPENKGFTYTEGKLKRPAKPTLIKAESGS